MMVMKMINKDYIAILICFGVGFALVMWMTHPVIGVHDDGFALLQPAMTGNPGNLTPHFPPLYPWLLYGLSRLGVDWNWGARLINAIALPTIAVLFSFGICSNLRRIYRYFLMGAILLSYTSLFRHAWVTAEPLFHLLLGAYFLIWLRYFNQTRYSIAWVALAGLCAASAIGVRYAGLAFWPVAAISILAMQRGAISTLLAHIATFVSVSGTPLLVLIWWNRQRAGTAVNREILFLGISSERLAQFRVTVLEFFLPYRVFDVFSELLQWFLILFVTIVLLVSVIVTWSRFRSVYLLIVSFILSYLAVVVATIALSDRTTPFDHRIMAPVFLCMLSLIACILSDYDGRLSTRHHGRIFLAGATVLFLFFSAFRGVQYANRAHTDGLGHFSKAWMNSEAMDYVSHMIDHRTIYSNAARTFNFRLVGSQVRTLPYKESVYTGVPNAGFDEAIELMATDIRDNGAIVVISRLFHGSDDEVPPYLPTTVELIDRIDLTVITNLSDGVVLGGNSSL
jgi:hypothetical protein